MYVLYIIVQKILVLEYSTCTRICISVLSENGKFQELVLNEYIKLNL